MDILSSKTHLSPSKAKRQVTAKDIADIVGVARPTVSMVLSGSRSNTNVAEATREKILRVAQELGYRPNLAARAMKSGKSQQVGVLVRNNSRVTPQERGSHPLSYEFVLGISEGLEEAGYMMNFVRMSDIDPGQHTQSSAFQGHLLDGLIVVSDVPAASASHLESLVPHCIWLDATVWHKENCVRRDEVHTGSLAMRSLIELGYREVICLAQDFEVLGRGDTHYSLEQRWQGILAASEQGVKVTPRSINEGKDEGEFFRSLASELLPTTAVLALGYYTASRLQQQIGRWGKCVGTDFALACCEGGFDSLTAGWPELSRVDFSRFDMGSEAAQMMLSLIGTDLEPDLNRLPKRCASRIVRGDWIAGTTAPPVPER
jgi:DNA-binding LacI/PurR family transcriptional regulator